MSPVINPGGQIAGLRNDRKPFLWTPSLPNSAAGTSTTVSESTVAEVKAINDYGQFGGDGYLWTPATANSSSGTLRTAGAEWTTFADINQAGQLLVLKSGQWSLLTPSSRGSVTGTYATVPVPAGSAANTAVAVNASGQVAGHSCASSSVCTVFLATPGAQPAALLQVSPPPGFASMTARDINNSGDIVGAMSPPGRSTNYPFLYTKGVVYDLSTANAALRGGVAGAVNNAGQVVVSTQTGTYLVSPLTVVPPSVTLTLSHSDVRFGAVVGTSIAGQQEIAVTLAGTNAASTVWTASTASTWLMLSPVSGTGSGRFLVTASALTSPIAGPLDATITVTTGGVTKTIRVTAMFTAPAATLPPYGVVDTPSANSSASGAVNVTGWALDDTEVIRIAVWRKAVAGEAGVNGQIYIGDAVLVEGARPDVAVAYPGAPLKTRAGWGRRSSRTCSRMLRIRPGRAGTERISSSFTLSTGTANRRFSARPESTSTTAAP